MNTQSFTIPIRMFISQSEGIAYLNNVRINFPKYIPKGKLANFLESYAVNQELCIWLSSTITSTPVYDSLSARWTIEVQHGDQKVILNPKHLVLATGSGSPHIPTWNGMGEFTGPLYHSDFHTDAEQFRGKRVIVVGAVSHICTLHTCVRAYDTVRAMLVRIYAKIS
jgi:cation diffusion facilitator CzcD-associated flavoprotein CzcO